MPSTVFANALVRTLDSDGTLAEAIAVTDERIVAVGGLAECRDAVRGPEVDLGGAVVLPGFVDAHVHFASYARDREWLDLRRTPSPGAALDAVRAHATGLPATGWVLGGRFDLGAWGDAPLRADLLDAAAQGRPAVLASRDGQTVWASTAALRSAGLAAGPGSGALRGPDAVRVRMHATDAQSVDVAALFRRRFGELLAAGLTGIHDIDGPDAWAAYAALRAAGELPLRVHKTIPIDLFEQAIADGWRTGDGDAWLRTGPVKVFADGTLSTRNAAMLAPYPDGGRGEERYPPGELAALVRRAVDAGIAVAAHAIGDRANRGVLDAFAAVAVDSARAGLRHRVEHAQHLAAADLPRFAELGVIASMQPAHCVSDQTIAQAALGDRDVYSYAWRSLAESGAVLAFGSDTPVEPPLPLAGVHAALTRRRADAGPAAGWQPEQCLDVDTAVRAYVQGTAYASYEEKEKGCLQPGRLADFVALSADPYTVAADAVPQIAVEHTVVGGKLRWSR